MAGRPRWLQLSADDDSTKAEEQCFDRIRVDVFKWSTELLCSKWSLLGELMIRADPNAPLAN